MKVSVAAGLLPLSTCTEERSGRLVTVLASSGLLQRLFDAAVQLSSCSEVMDALVVSIGLAEVGL